MKNVELIRSRIAAAQYKEFIRLRAFISMNGGDRETLALMEGKDGEHRLARIVEYVMSELGHETELADERGSKARRAVSRARGVRAA